MYDKLGYQWASSFLGFLLLAMLRFPYIFFRYGKKIKEASKFVTGREMEVDYEKGQETTMKDPSRWAKREMPLKKTEIKPEG